MGWGVPVQGLAGAVVEFGGDGVDHLWRFAPGGGAWLKLMNKNSGKVMAVSGMSTADSADITQFSDSGSADHLWKMI